ncbi:MAG: hypothetical protein FWC86_02120 [Coriobacteriia bacterium]|nr:hypothetical protein [Coriobacteriia bacterium]
MARIATRGRNISRLAAKGREFTRLANRGKTIFEKAGMQVKQRPYAVAISTIDNPDYRGDRIRGDEWPVDGWLRSFGGSYASGIIESFSIDENYLWDIHDSGGGHVTVHIGDEMPADSIFIDRPWHIYMDIDAPGWNVSGDPWGFTEIWR